MPRNSSRQPRDSLVHFARQATHSTEDDTLSDRQQVVELQQYIILDFLALAIHVKLFDPLDAELFRFQTDLVGIRCEALGESVYSVGEGGGEQQGLGDGRDHPSISERENESADQASTTRLV